MKSIVEAPDSELIDFVAQSLAAEGFHCDPLVSEKDGLEWWSLMVPEDEYEKAALRAEEIVEDYVPEGASQKTISCPRCGSRNVRGEDIECENSLRGSVISLRCRDCGFEWGG